MVTDDGDYDLVYLWDSSGGITLLGWASSVFNEKEAAAVLGGLFCRLPAGPYTILRA